MTPVGERPPYRVCAAFGVDEQALTPLPDGEGWQCGGVALRPVVDAAEVAWAARTLDSIRLPDVRISRPARATDGRMVVGGWMAYRTPGSDGEPGQGNGKLPCDDVVLVSIKLQQALADLPRPGFLAQRDDVLARADRAAWGEADIELDVTRGGRWFEVIAGSVKPVELPNQVVHAELYRSVHLGSDGIPVVTGFRPFYRPAVWAVALVVVDAVAAGDAGAELIEQWAALPEWLQMLRRALLFRLAVHALTPAEPEQLLDDLRRAAGLVSDVRSA